MKKLKEENKVTKTAYEWASASGNNVHKEDYHGGQLNGPNCDRLHQLAIKFTEFLPKDLKKFGIALQALKKVSHSCFSMTLGEDWENDLTTFLVAYDALDIGYTPKVHALAVHVPQFIKKTGKSLGRFTEQPFEALHADLKKVWQNYKRNRKNEAYPFKLTGCVVAYNSNNL